MTIKINDNKVKAVLAEVEAELGSLLKAETARLAKASEESPGESDEGSSPASPPGPASPSPDASASPVDASASPDAPPAGPDAPPADGAPMDPAADQGPLDPEALMAEYAKLPPEELQVHLMAVKAALAQVTGQDPDAGGPGMPPPASPSAPPMPPASPSPAPAMKAEVTGDMGSRPANGGTQSAAVPDAIKAEQKLAGEALAKAQSNVKELQAKFEDQDKQIEALVKAVDLALGQPMRKAVTGLSYVPRVPESKDAPSKAEVSAKLSELTRSHKLSKSEGERVIAFSMGHIGYDQIKDLLEKK